MEYVKIPLNIAQKAMRAYRPILPYVRKFLAEQRQANKVQETPKEATKKKKTVKEYELS